MKYILLFLGLFLYADISNILFEIDKIENYKPVFKKIYFKKCKKINQKISKEIINNKFELKLMAIFNDKALINHKWVKKGDEINGFKVVKIYSKKVVLKKDNRILILGFDNNILKAVK